MKLTVIALTALVTTDLFAQSHYAGMQSRPIKALSEQQISDLKAGRGMGLALPAELNGYPGPAHILELSEKLDLSRDQMNRVRRLFRDMKAEALPIGARLIEQESALDKQFANRSITPEWLRSGTIAIGMTQAKLRNTHLRYHLKAAQILSHRQMRQYAELRGYTPEMPSEHRHMK